MVLDEGRVESHKHVQSFSEFDQLVGEFGLFFCFFHLGSRLSVYGWAVQVWVLQQLCGRLCCVVFGVWDLRRVVNGILKIVVLISLWLFTDRILFFCWLQKRYDKRTLNLLLIVLLWVEGISDLVWQNEVIRLNLLGVCGL